MKAKYKASSPQLTNKQRQTAAKKRIARRYENIAKSINRVEHPVRQSLFIAAALLLLGFILGFVLAAISQTSYLVNFMSSYAIVLALVIVWALSRLGWAEKSRLRFRNYRNNRLVQRTKVEVSKVMLTRDEFKVFIKKQSWIGIIAAAAISAAILLILLLVNYL